jgi:hypothetical protein
MEISIDPCFTNSGRDTALSHEIIHAIDRVYNNQSLPEDGVDALAEGLTQVMRESFGIELDWSEVPHVDEETS